MSEKRVVGIRGLDIQIYEQIQELARLKNENVANIINDALRNYLEGSNDVEYKAPQTISGQNRFELTAEALQHLSPLRIEDVQTLIILDDNEEITKTMIEENLDLIIRVQDIFTPKRLYYFILKKTKNIGNINQYENKWREEKILRFQSSTKLNLNIFERFKKENLKVKIIVSSGDLYLDPDITINIFEDVVSQIMVKGNLVVSEELYPTVLTIGSIDGNVQLIDKEGKPVDQIQFEGNFFTQEDNTEKSAKRRKQKAQSVFGIPFAPGLENLVESIEELKEGFAKAFKNINIDFEGIEGKIEADLGKEFTSPKKTRVKVKPTKVKKVDEDLEE